MTDQTFEQSLVALRDWLLFLDSEEQRLKAKLERLRRASAREDAAPPHAAPPTEGTLPVNHHDDDEEDDWL